MTRHAGAPGGSMKYVIASLKRDAMDPRLPLIERGSSRDLLMRLTADAEARQIDQAITGEFERVARAA